MKFVLLFVCLDIHIIILADKFLISWQYCILVAMPTLERERERVRERHTEHSGEQKATVKGPWIAPDSCLIPLRQLCPFMHGVVPCGTPQITRTVISGRDCFFLAHPPCSLSLYPSVTPVFFFFFSLAYILASLL